MSQILESFVNIFTPEQYPPDEQTGRSEVPIEDIFEEVYKRVDNFAINITQMGYRPDGGPFVGIKITIPIENGQYHVVVGSADATATMGVSGVQTMAIKNAFLRNLRMGELLYKNNTIKEAEVATAVGQVQEATPVAQPQAPQPAGGWDGMLKVKNGKWANTYYKDLPVEVLQGWAKANISTAKAELNRRGINPDAASYVGGTAQATLSNSPFKPR